MSRTEIMTFEEYAALPGLTQSGLKPILVSPLEYQRSKRQPRKDTTALAFGRAVDVAAFEPAQYALQFAVIPEKPPTDMQLNTAEGKKRRREWNETHPEDATLLPDEWRAKVYATETAGKTILSRDEHDRAWRCGEILRTHELTARYFADFRPQVVIQWTDRITGLQLKGRIDMVPNCEPCLGDLKSTKSVDRASFGRDIARYLYHFQAAMYRQGWAAQFGEWLDFKLFAIESNDPHDVGVFLIDGDALQRGNELVRQALDTYARCRDAGKWPGRYTQEESALLPRWAFDWSDGDIKFEKTDPADDVPLDVE